MTRGHAARSTMSVLGGAVLLLAACALPAGAGIASPAAGQRPASPAPGPRPASPAPGRTPRRRAAPGPRTAAQLQGAGARPAGCAANTGPRVAHCYLASQPAPARAAVRDAACPVNAQAGWSACNLEHAYGISPLISSHGRGQTIAVIDAYDDPNAASDLAAYRSNYGLPPCAAASGCFTKVNQTGGTAYPSGDMGWGQEISIDLDMVSAICPRCHILLVEANSAGFGDMFTAEQQAISMGAHVISNSWGTGEFSGEASYDSTLNTAGVAITDSSGDGAFQGGVQYPSASPYVTSVGGTMLIPAANPRGWTEKTWVTAGSPPTQGSGSGCSAYENNPPWQAATPAAPTASPPT